MDTADHDGCAGEGDDTSEGPVHMTRRAPSPVDRILVGRRHRPQPSGASDSKAAASLTTAARRESLVGLFPSVRPTGAFSPAGDCLPPGEHSSRTSRASRVRIRRLERPLLGGRRAAEARMPSRGAPSTDP
jgi:hypothetical protein